jgi:hypothetical protein
VKWARSTPSEGIRNEKSEPRNLSFRLKQARNPEGETLEAWQEEIACMWRFTKNNGITEQDGDSL